MQYSNLEVHVLLLWIGFVVFVLSILALDLGVFHRHAHVVSVREALGWSGIWATLGLSFSVFIYFGYDRQWFGLGTQIDPVDGLVNTGATAVQKYLTGYIVEKSLSVDNIFVIALIFGFFAVPAIYQHRVLFWGIIGAFVLRGAMIALGSTLIARFHWILYVFGAFLIITAIKMLLLKTDETDPGKNIVVRLTRKVFPITSHFHGEHFFVRAGSASSHESELPGGKPIDDAVADHTKIGTWMFTPLALALVMVETTDVIFAVDSIPAIFAISADPFIVFTSNVFAILGLRALFFALAGMIDKFRYLKLSFAIILMVVGVKMFVADWLKQTLGTNYNFYLLGVIVLILGVGAFASWLAAEKDKRDGILPPGHGSGGGH